MTNSNRTLQQNWLPAMSAMIQTAGVLLLALTSVSLLLLALGLSPLRIAQVLLAGVTGSWQQFGQLLSIWTPLLLCSCGLLFTFRAGLWNIGVEGQIVAGAIGATAVLRWYGPGLSPVLYVVLACAAAAMAGAGWAALAGWLKNRGGVNEIFGGLGLNFVAQGLIVWLILGPWKRAGMASMSGTDFFPRELWLMVPAGWRVSPLALAIAVLAFCVTVLLLEYSRFGLEIRAIGRNQQAARLFGIVVGRRYLAAMALGGGLAGIAGAVQVLGVYHRLLPPVSSGYGYLALLVVMLAGYRIWPSPLLCLFFAALAAGSIQLPLVLQLDSALSGVIQGACVLAALTVHGFWERRRGAR